MSPLLLFTLKEVPTSTYLAGFYGEVGLLVCLCSLVASGATSNKESRETLKQVRGDAILARDNESSRIGKIW